MKVIVILSFCLPIALFAQSNYAPLNEDYYHLVDRYEVKSGKIIPHVFTTVKPYKRSDIISFTEALQAMGTFTSKQDLFNLEFLKNDSWEWSRSDKSDSSDPIFKHFYKKESDFFFVDEDGLDLHINPVVYVGAGTDSRGEEILFTNSRGIEARGMIDKKVGFYTYLTDNQVLLPSYVRDQMVLNPVVPHEGFWKQFKSGQGVDFLQARGYITIDPTKHTNVQFGHDRFFIGNGYRSLIFSDFAPPSLFLKGNVKIWKLNYLFMVNQMTADVTGSINGLQGTRSGYPEKFTALHHLSVNIGEKFNLGIFESVVFSASDTLGADHFRLEYLNPIIFYRAIEQQNGSSDNVLLGLDFKWNAVKKLSLYGQFVLDEFVIDHIRSGDGWWGNKFGVQAGAKYVDAFGAANLDLQGEINVVRPYTYSHNTNYGNYSHYRQPIAHPLGANFREIAGILRYQPLPRVNIKAKLSMVQVGRDTVGGSTWGSNVLVKNSPRPRDFGNVIAQGVGNDILFGSLNISWHVKHNLFLDASVIVRQSRSELDTYNNDTAITSLALRWNIPQRLYEF